MVARINQNCFCGAAFQLEVPILFQDDAWMYSFEPDEQIEHWHQNHYHQVNPQMGPVLDGETTEAVAETGPREMGFHVPGH